MTGFWKNRIWNLLLGIYIVYVLFLMFVIDKSAECYVESNYRGKNIFLLPFVIMVAEMGYAFYKCPLKIKSCNFCRNLMFVNIVFLVFQLWISKNIWFYTGWDVDKMLSSASLIAQGGVLEDSYFSMYPNNLFLTFIFSLIIKMGIKLGISNGYVLCIALGVLCINVAIYLSVVVYFHITESWKMSVIVYVMELLLIGCSPWMVIPYSDAIAIFFVSASISMYILGGEDQRKWYIVVPLTAMGYLIKPTVAIVLIAILVNEGLKQWGNLKKEITLALIALGFIVCFKALDTFTEKMIEYQVDEDQSFSLLHYMMMGLNNDTDGVFSQEDVYFSQNFATAEDRKQANVEKSLDRLKMLGLYGYLEHLSRKTLIAYNDGTFAWQMEGGFYKDIPITESKASYLLRNIFYKDGKYQSYFSAVEQILWITVLLGMIPCLFGKAQGDVVPVIALMLFGLSLFLLMFEVRARYLFLYAPWYVVLGGIGYEKLFLFQNKIIMKMNKRNDNMVV